MSAKHQKGKKYQNNGFCAYSTNFPQKVIFLVYILAVQLFSINYYYCYIFNLFPGDSTNQTSQNVAFQVVFLRVLF